MAVDHFDTLELFVSMLSPTSFSGMLPVSLSEPRAFGNSSRHVCHSSNVSSLLGTSKTWTLIGGLSPSSRRTRDSECYTSLAASFGKGLS